MWLQYKHEEPHLATGPDAETIQQFVSHRLFQKLPVLKY
jgi:hypothetical protein